MYMYMYIYTLPFFMFLKEVYYAHQGCNFFNKNIKYIKY